MKPFKLLLLLLPLVFAACEDDDPSSPAIDEPASYSFDRNGQSTVSFDGQTTRISMGEALIAAMMDFDATNAQLLEMYRNETASGGDANPFEDATLNASSKSIRNKVAASSDFFFSNTTASAAIKTQFESWITAQVEEVFPNELQAAAPGQAGQIADGTSVRYVNTQGLEYNQLVNKGLIGALMTDQMLNNYLSTAILDDQNEGRQKNDEGVLEAGKPYTQMEHKWDEAYGYAYGTSADPANPNTTIGADDSFLNKYIARVDGDPDFSGIAETIFNAFKRGRAAIVAKEYEVRDEQAEIIREAVSEVIAVRAVFYLQQARLTIEQNPSSLGGVFHDLSEAYGFIYSLQFTRMPGTGQPYFSGTEVDGLLTDLLGDGPNGLWDITPETLDALSNTIADRFNFSVETAGE